MAAEHLTSDETADRRIGVVLFVGLVSAIAVMAAGLILAAAQGHDVSHVLPLDRLPARLLEGDGRAIADAGILLLFATPLAGVVAALFSFAAQRDTRLVAVTVALLILLVAGFAIALR